MTFIRRGGQTGLDILKSTYQVESTESYGIIIRIHVEFPVLLSRLHDITYPLHSRHDRPKGVVVSKYYRSYADKGVCTFNEINFRMRFELQVSKPLS